MGGVLHRRDDDKADGKTDSKTDIKIKDNGKDKGHCIGSYDSMGSLQMVIWLNDCRISTAWDKLDWEMTSVIMQRPTPAIGKHVSKSDCNCDSQKHFLVIVSRGFRLSPKKPGLRVYPVSNKSPFWYARKEFHIHS